MPTDILEIPKTLGSGPTTLTKTPESTMDSFLLRCTIFGRTEDRVEKPM
jgi:hypothetical protein